jgi:glycosyltransferase involved in cell wall biosynthesis
MPYFSVVTPVYCCKTSLYELYARIKETLGKINSDFEIIMVNDSSPDGAWDIIVELAKKDRRVKGLNLSKNFGQHCAITAGLDICKGEWVILIDCDLQDRPEEIIKLYNKALEGYDYVQGRRERRKDKLFKRFFSWAFYWVLEYFTDTKFDSSIANFGIYNNRVIKSVNSLREKSRWFPTFVNWVGFNGTSVVIQHDSRKNGGSSYTFRKLANIGLDVIVLNSNKPLKLVLKFGFLISLTAFIFALITLIRYLRGDVTVLGWTSLIISIWLLSGIMIFILGIIGLYISKIYDHSKDRPLYIIKENTINL